MDDTYRIKDLAGLEHIYGPAVKFSRKESDHIHPDFREFILRAPFVVLATSGPSGLSASAKGDAAGFVKLRDERTLLIPDRGANGRNDSLRNIVTDPRIALIFLIPGEADMLRVSGHAYVSTDPQLLAEFSLGSKEARSVIVMHVEEALCQCSRAIQKSNLWAQHLATTAAADTADTQKKLIEVEQAASDRAEDSAVVKRQPASPPVTKFFSPRR